MNQEHRAMFVPGDTKVDHSSCMRVCVCVSILNGSSVCGYPVSYRVADLSYSLGTKCLVLSL
jgi:hypothetical protein